MPKTISVYFNGTDDDDHIPNYGRITLAALLDYITAEDNHNHFSICVNGCGIETQDMRDLGVIFTFHLEKQVLKIAQQVENIIKNSQEQVTLNVFGFSRGGAAAFWLCQKLKHISPDDLTINIAPFEPVPGNFIMGVYGDFLLGTNTTLSAAVADLTECKNIANALVLFTNQPLPDFACHAPILPALPSTCHAEIDVTPGCHKNAVAFYKDGDAIAAGNEESAIVFHRIVEFMQKCGTSFQFDRVKLTNNLICSNTASSHQELLKLYEYLATKTAFNDDGQRRSMHLHNTIFTNRESKRYLNHYHQRLLCRIEDANDSDCVLTIQNRHPQRMSSQQRQAIQLLQLLMVLAMGAIIYNKYFNEPALDDNNQFRPRL